MRERVGEERMHRPNMNGSQFFITTKAQTHALGGSTITHLDYRHVVFGRVAKGMDVVCRINKLPVGKNHLLTVPVVIEDCGEVVVADDSAPAPPVAAEEAAPARAPASEAEALDVEDDAALLSADPVPGCREAERDDSCVSAEVD
jgi:cyclophilin family peptidyl-prolyl cis-trans isomerase